MAQPVVLLVRFVLKEGHGDDFDSLMSDTLNGIRSREAGTLVYAVHTVEGEPLVRIFYELYRDVEAFAAHEREPHTRYFLDQRHEHVESYMVDRLSPTTTKGLGTPSSATQ